MTNILLIISEKQVFFYCCGARACFSFLPLVFLMLLYFLAILESCIEGVGALRLFWLCLY